MLFSLGLRLEWMLGHVNNLLVLLNSEHKAGNLSLWNRIRFCLHHCRQWLKISSSFRKLILKLIKLNIIRPCRWTSSKRVVTVKLFPAFMRKSTEAKVLLSIFMEFDIQAAPFLVNFPSIHRDVSELSQLSITLHYWLHSNIEFPSFFSPFSCDLLRISSRILIEFPTLQFMFTLCDALKWASEKLHPTRTSHGDKLNIYKIGKHSVVRCVRSDNGLLWVALCRCVGGEEKNLRTRISIGWN